MRDPNADDFGISLEIRAKCKIFCIVFEFGGDMANSQLKMDRLFLGSIIMSVMLFMGCNNNKNNDSNPSPEARKSLPQQPNIANIPISGGWEPGEGKLEAANGDAETFNGALHAMIAAFINPENLGRVDPQNGVRLKGYVAIDQTSGKVDTNKSGIVLEITDDLVGKKDDNGETFAVIKLGAQITSVQFGQNNAARVIMKNSGAEYMMEGSLNEHEFKGFFMFRNLSSYTSTGQKHEGKIPFSIRTCQFFQCN